MASTCDLRPFLYDQVPAPQDETGLQLSQEQLQSYLAELLEAVCTDITDLESGGGGGGATTFLGLTDTPSTYAGQAGKRVVVNGTEDALEFETISSAPDSDGLVLDYSTSEQTTNRTYTGGETIFQKTVNFGALPNNTTKNVAHGISGDFRVIRHDFWARRASDGLQVYVPNVSNVAIGSQTQISIGGTNITLRNSVNSSAFIGQITLWYIKL